MAAVLALINVEKKITNKFCLQGLVNAWLQMDEITPSMLSKYGIQGNGFLSLNQLISFKWAYLPLQNQYLHASNYTASPLRVNNNILSQVPPAIILTGAFDILHDESIMYSKKLDIVKKLASLHVYNQGHIFLAKPIFGGSDSTNAFKEIIKSLNDHCFQ